MSLQKLNPEYQAAVDLGHISEQEALREQNGPGARADLNVPPVPPVPDERGETSPPATMNRTSS